MKRSILSSLGVASIVLASGLVGCGGGSVEEGMPKGDLTPAVPLDPKMVDMSGRSFSDVGKAKAKSEAAAKAAEAAEAPK
jgi:hypothetical protein